MNDNEVPRKRSKWEIIRSFSLVQKMDLIVALAGIALIPFTITSHISIFISLSFVSWFIVRAGFINHQINVACRKIYMERHMLHEEMQLISIVDEYSALVKVISMMRSLEQNARSQGHKEHAEQLDYVANMLSNSYLAVYEQHTVN